WDAGVVRDRGLVMGADDGEVGLSEARLADCRRGVDDQPRGEQELHDDRERAEHRAENAPGRSILRGSNHGGFQGVTATVRLAGPQCTSALDQFNRPGASAERLRYDCVARDTPPGLFPRPRKPLQLGGPPPLPASPDAAQLDRVPNPHPDTAYAA